MKTRIPTILTDPEILKRLHFKGYCAKCPEVCRIDHAPGYRWNPKKEAICPDKNGELLCSEVRDYYYSKEYDDPFEEMSEVDLLVKFGRYDLDDERGFNSALDLAALKTEPLSYLETDEIAQIFQTYYTGQRTTPQWLEAMQILSQRKDEDEFIKILRGAEEALMLEVSIAQAQAKTIEDGRKRRKWELTHNQIKLFILRYVRGWAPSKISRLTGTSKQNVSKEIGKARRKIAHLRGWTVPRYYDLYNRQDKKREEERRVIYQLIMTTGKALEVNKGTWPKAGLIISRVPEEILETFREPMIDFAVKVSWDYFEPINWPTILYIQSKHLPPEPPSPRTKYAIQEARSEYANHLSTADLNILWSHCFKSSLTGRCQHSVNVVAEPSFGDGKPNYRPTHYGTCPHIPGSEACSNCSPFPEHSRRFKGKIFTEWEYKQRKVLLKKLLKILKTFLKK